MAYDDNPYIDFLKEDLNIEVVYDWVASSTDYEEKMNLCIGSNTVPELMNVNATQYRALLKYDMIQPLDEYFDDYASDALKSYVKSGGEELQKCITNEDGEMMAIPAPAITAGGINEMWIRQDWLDSLGLEAPRTWDELVNVAEAFVTQDPDGNGEDDTIGILGPSNSDHMNAIGGNQYGLDPLFSSFQSYPQYWLQGEDGTVEYGSIQPETRDALEKISELYTNKTDRPGNACKEVTVKETSSGPGKGWNLLWTMVVWLHSGRCYTGRCGRLAGILYTIVRGWKLLHSYGRAYNTICSSKQSMQESGSCI